MPIVGAAQRVGTSLDARYMDVSKQVHRVGMITLITLFVVSVSDSIFTTGLNYNYNIG